MDVILHIGAHRTGSTTFQSYLRRSSAELARDGVGYWGPGRTRSGLFAGILPGRGPGRSRDPIARGEGRIRLQLLKAQAAGIRTLIVSDENMIGSVRENLRARVLYPGIGERMARFATAFDGRIAGVMICPRSLDLYWCSALAYGVARGVAVPNALTLRKITLGKRSWRDVLADLACALPGAQIRVLPFESFAGRPDALLDHGTDLRAPVDRDRRWLNRAPDLTDLRQVLRDRDLPPDRLPEGDGRWTPFSCAQLSELRERYADDMMWLTAGADGMAILTEDRNRKRAGHSLPPAAQRQGHPHEPEKPNLAQSG